MRVGVVFGEVSEVVAGAIAEARTCAQVRWVGRPNQQYQARLSELCGDLGRVRSSFEEASAALVGYGRVLGTVRELALQAYLLRSREEDAVAARQAASWRDSLDGSVLSPVGVRTPQEQAWLERAALLQREAEELEATASRRVAARLRQLAAEAPRVSGWTNTNRGIGRAVDGAVGPMVGLGQLAGDVVLALPGVTDPDARDAARQELWAAGAALAQPWLMVESFLDELEQGQYAHAGGGLAGVLVLRGFGGRRVDLFGAHDDMPLGVLASLKQVPILTAKDTAAWVAEHGQALFWAELQRFRGMAAPTVEKLLADGVDLVQQEALGGHTLLKHVGRDLEFLAKRQGDDKRANGWTNPASSFASQAEAEVAVHRVMTFGDNPERLRAWAETATEGQLRIRGPVDGIGRVIGISGQEVRSESVILEFRRRPGGIFLNSGFIHGPL